MRSQLGLIERAYSFRAKVQLFCSKLQSESYSDTYAINWLRDQFKGPLDLLIETETLHKPIDVQEPILLVTPGTGKTTGIVALFWAYITAEEPITVGVSSRDSWLRDFITTYFKDEVKIAPTLSSLELDQFKATVRTFGTVIVYGTDETIQLFSSSTLPATRFVGYGSKFSIGLHVGEIKESDLKRYRDDLMIYDGLGCLNTSVLYVKELTSQNRHCLEHLSEQLEYHYRDNFDAQHFHKSFQQGLFLGGYDRIGNLFGLRQVNEDSDDKPLREFLLPMGYGTLTVVDLGGDIKGMARDLKGRGELLSSATLNSSFSTYLSTLVGCGVQRVVPIGQAQNPSLSWSHDGRSNLCFATLLDVE